MKKIFKLFIVILAVVSFASGTYAAFTPIAVTGVNPTALTIDSNDNVYVANAGGAGGGEDPNTVTKITPAEVATHFVTLTHVPDDIIVDSSGTVFYTLGVEDGSILKITSSEGLFSPSTLVSELSGVLASMVIDSNDNIYIVSENNVVKISPEGDPSIFGLNSSDVPGSPAESGGGKGGGPTISIDSDSITVLVGDEFIDPGATATDPEDGDISANIIVGGDTVDTSTPGVYVITYEVIDSDLNSSGQVSLTVTVQEASGTRGDEIIALAIDDNDNIYTLDIGFVNTVTKITQDQESSIFTELDEEPLDLAINSQGEVFVSTSSEIRKFNLAGEEIRKLTENPGPKGGPMIDSPFYSEDSGLGIISIDREGSIYAEYNSPFGFPVIRKISKDGNFLGSLGAFYVGNIAIDSNLNVYTERFNTNTVYKYSQISLIEQSEIGVTEDPTPSYSFTSNKAGDITFGGSCSSATTAAVAGTNTISFNELAPGTYGDCTIQLSDGIDISNTLEISDFTIEQAKRSGGSTRLSKSETTRLFALARTRPTKDKKEIKENQGNVEERTRPTEDKKDIKNNSLNISSQERCSADKTITRSLSRQGDRNEEVKLIQEHINRILADYYELPAGPVDGIFGPLTKLGVQRLQEALAQEQGADLGAAGVDGIVGPYTREAINNSC